MEITLTQLLDAREDRVRKQRKMQEENKCPLICFTMNIAGPAKTSDAIKRAFNYGIASLDKKLEEFEIPSKKIEYPLSGPTAFYSVLGDAETIKKLCVEIEESCPLGRLFDMDVIDTSLQKIERHVQRRCIICGKEGRSCAAGRVHSVQELQNKTAKIIAEHFAVIDADIISRLGKKALIQEVMTTPKPGLVDSDNSGSHTDMNLETFLKSADAIHPYFKKCFDIGVDTTELDPAKTFELLREEGLQAEKDMYLATNGINTHKGIIYSLGIIMGAIGRLWSTELNGISIENILKECARLVEVSTKNDLEKIDESTAGGRLYLTRGKAGIRGEVALGFPSIHNIGLPAYKNAINGGYNKNDAGVITLLHLIANIYDSNLYNRGGNEGVLWAQDYAKKLCGVPFTTDGIKKMDDDFIKKNLSPGGSADLLAITYFLAELEDLTKKI